MIWRTVIVARAALGPTVEQIRLAGGTLVNCVRRPEGFCITCTFPGDSSPQSVAGFAS